MPEPIRFEHVAPILRVQDLDASLAYYERALGFRQAWRHRSVIAEVVRGRGAVMLCQGHQGQPGTWVWLGVSDVEPLFSEFTAAGATIGLPPTNYPWALELHVLDPDGHVLRFGSEPLDDLPKVDWVTWYRVERGGRVVAR
jgi:catechol 2,3-dioxygenase-like lactoylglutathione lyase family enzyme